MNENTTQMTEIEQETVTTSTETAPEETPTQSQEESQNQSSSEIIESLPGNSDNVMHQLFAELGVDLDYTPQNPYQCFTMGLQFFSAWLLIWSLVKYLFTLMRSFLSKRW